MGNLVIGLKKKGSIMKQQIKRIVSVISTYLKDRDFQYYLLFLLVLYGSLFTLAYIHDVYYEGGCLRSLPVDKFEQCKIEVEQRRDKNPDIPSLH
jgi:hypothetical protein